VLAARTVVELTPSVHADRHALKGDRSVPADSSTATTTSYISQDLYPSSCCAQSRTSIFSSPFYHPLCGYLLPAGLPNCCLLPTACCLLAAAVGSAFAASESGRFDLKSSTPVHVRVLARLAGRGRWYSPVWYLPWMVASVSPYASPSPPAACFAPPCHAFCHRRLQLCSTSVGEPPPCVHVRAQHALAARTSVHELLPSIHSYSTLQSTSAHC